MNFARAGVFSEQFTVLVVKRSGLGLHGFRLTAAQCVATGSSVVDHESRRQPGRELQNFDPRLWVFTILFLNSAKIGDF